VSEPIRLNKWLSQLGIVSRRGAEKWIEDGRIVVNGETVSDLGRKVIPGTDHVEIDGKTVGDKAPPKVYWLFNKPDQTLCSAESEDGKPTIFMTPKLAKVPFKVFTVGRLDFRTEGLLLLSNDGELVHRLMHPSYKVERHYIALVNGKLPREKIQEIRKGFDLEDGPVSARIHHAEGRDLGGSKGTSYHISLTIGRNRIIRRIFEHFGLKVLRLVRYGFGDIRLDENLAPGDYRQLSAEEIKDLKKSCQL